MCLEIAGDCGDPNDGTYYDEIIAATDPPIFVDGFESDDTTR